MVKPQFNAAKAGVYCGFSISASRSALIRKGIYLRIWGSFTYYVISRGGGGVSKCLRLITGGGGGGLVVDYVIKILIFTNFRNTNWTIFVDFVIKIFIFTNF